MGVIFDLDQTLIDSSSAEKFRKSGNWREVYQSIPNFVLYNGISHALQYLKDNNIPYCIVTSSPSTYCQKVCSHWGIDQKHLVCFHDTKFNERKPHPAPILLALAKMKVEPESALSFGDRDIDIIASNKAEVKSVACLWGTDNPKSLLAAKPFYSIETPAEIIPLIKKHFNI